MPIDELSADPFFAAVREEESLFARGDDDALVRYVKPTLLQFEETVSLIIDGEAVTVPKAKPQTDALGNPRRGPDGNFIPRSTTIYDAALELVERKVFTPDELSERIPVLCHLKHLDPVAVCRMCSVHISSIKRGKFTPGRKLVPACQHRVEDKMAVLSRSGPRDISQFLKRLADEFKIKTDDLPKEQSVQDYITGLHVLLEDRYSDGDEIEATTPSGQRVRGVVARLGAFSTRLQAGDVTWHLSNRTMVEIANYSQRGIPVSFEFPIPEGTSTEQVATAARTVFQRDWPTSSVAVVDRVEVLAHEAVDPRVARVHVRASRNIPLAEQHELADQTRRRVID